MSNNTPERVRETVDAVYRSDSRRVFATLVRLLGEFEIAEEALHDAFRAALEQWPREGVPANPRAWLVSTGRFKAIDGIRRRAPHTTSMENPVKYLCLICAETVMEQMSEADAEQHGPLLAGVLVVGEAGDAALSGPAGR